MSSLLSAELAATCSALGYFDPKTNKYYADKDTLETVKDLIRYLRRDDENHEIRRQLGSTNVVKTDLLPLLKSYWEEGDLFDVLLRLIVNLTTPALILWNEEPPVEKTTRNYYLQVEGHLQAYKEAFVDEAIWAVLSTKLSKILEIDYAERGNENSLIIERILILVRNVLFVPPDPDAERRTDNDANVHDQVLWALHQSGMLDIILYITSSQNEQAYYMHILEILSFMLREQNASELAHAALQRSQTEKIKDEAELLAIRHRETNLKQDRMRKYAGARHSCFGGTFVVKSMKAIGDNELIYHKPLDKLEALNFDVDKSKPKTPRNRLPVHETSNERRSAFSIRLFLKEFCVEFLNGAYNTMMYHVKDNLVRARAQAHDESYYLWAMRFFMEFNRCYNFEVKLVSETMSVQCFHYVQQISEKYFDMISSDKKQLKQWSRRLHLAVLAYKELFMTLMVMDKSKDSAVRNSSRVIKNNIFYVLEYREFVLTLLVTYDELKMSDLYLNNLIETQHVFLKMLESFCAKEGTVVVQKKRKKHKAKKSGLQNPREERREVSLEQKWDELGPQVSAVLDGGLGEDVVEVPFDAASDIPIDEQKADAMKRIQRRLRQGEFERAIGLLRAARDVWPENDSFGTHNMAPEEEFLALREIFFADLGEKFETRQEQPQEYDDDEDDEDEDEDGIVISESDFKFLDFVKRMAHPKVVRACGLVLKKFESNSVMTNHCVVKLLHRIAYDAKMFVMVCQVSIFRTFQRIYKQKHLPQYKELVKFADFIMRKFFKLAQINKKLFMEALFWKSNGEACEIEHGYEMGGKGKASAAKAWSELEEDELRRLFVEHQQTEQSEDVVDWICSNLIDNTRTRRAVLKKLKELCLIVDYKKSGTKGRRPPPVWGAVEESQLRELYYQYKDSQNPLDLIMSHLDISRPKNRIVEKMLVMGLIQDKSEMRRKRTIKPPGGKKSRNEPEEVSDHSLIETSSDEEGPERPVQRSVQKERVISQPLKSNSAIARKVLEVSNRGLDEALEWLRESLSDAVEDLEDVEDLGGIPLVPIMEYASNAMEDQGFQDMLKAIGIQKPFDESETYWRIPSSLSVDQLKGFIEIIEKAVSKSLIVDDGEKEEEAHGSNEDQVDAVFDEGSLIDNDEGNEIKRVRSLSDSSSETEKPKVKRSRVILSDDEDD